MKYIALIATLIIYTTFSASAQHDHSTHQQPSSPAITDSNSRAIAGDKQTAQQLSSMFLSYTNLKNALVTGDAAAAASNADLFLRTVNTIDFKVISEGNLHILANNAGKISSTKDLQKQREYFAALSSNMVAVAKAFKLSEKPVYVQYCPMKKASWLSAEKDVRNPYYGSSMLTCGEVTEAL